MANPLTEPRFDIDLPYGKQGELQIKSYLEWIASGNGRVEVKRKRRIDSSFYVELSCDKGGRRDFQKSGLNVTTAEAWAFVVGATGVALVVPTRILKAAVKFQDPPRPFETRRGSAPTKGRLVSLDEVLRAAKWLGLEED